MYFTDLTNNELEVYHNKAKMDGFSVNLQTMQNSSLFRTLNIGGGIYKCIPLFYVDKIECNDDRVKILDNKVVLINENNNSYINFYNDNVYNMNLNYHNLWLKTFDVGDDLSQEDFNNLVYLMKKNTIFYDEIRIKNGIVNGVYADYEITPFNATIIDNGFLLKIDKNLTILRGTKALKPKIVPFKVKLTNTYFKDAKYSLMLNIIKIKDVNLDINDKHNYIETIPIKQELVPNVTTDIDLYGKINFDGFNYVALYDAKIIIENDKPIINTGEDEFKITSLTYDTDRNITVNAQLIHPKQEDTILNVLARGIHRKDIIIPKNTYSGSVVEDTFRRPGIYTIQLYNPASNKYCLPKTIDMRNNITKYKIDYIKDLQAGIIKFRIRYYIDGTDSNNRFNLNYIDTSYHEQYFNLKTSGSYIQVSPMIEDVWLQYNCNDETSTHTFKIEFIENKYNKPSIVEDTFEIGDVESGEHIIETN